MPERSVVALVGPSGSGKSTLLKVVAGLPWPCGKPAWSSSRCPFTSMVHSREQIIRVQVGVRRNGTLSGMDAQIIVDAGAHLHTKGNAPALLTSRMLPGPYRLTDPALLERQREARAAGRLYGVGLATLVEYTRMGPSRLMRLAGNRQVGYETTLVRINPSGTVACYSGLIELGQGTMTALTQICADFLWVSPEAVNVYSGDTQLVPYSFYGTAASRGTALAGGAVRHLSDPARVIPLAQLALCGVNWPAPTAWSLGTRFCAS